MTHDMHELMIDKLDLESLPDLSRFLQGGGASISICAFQA